MNFEDTESQDRPSYLSAAKKPRSTMKASKTSFLSSDNKQDIQVKAKFVCDFLKQINNGKDFQYEKFYKVQLKLDEVRDISVQLIKLYTQDVDDYSGQKLEDFMPGFLVEYQYHQTVNKSMFKSLNSSSWPRFLGILHWLCQLLHDDMEISQADIYEDIQYEDLSDNQKQDKKRYQVYINEHYRLYLEGNDEAVQNNQTQYREYLKQKQQSILQDYEQESELVDELKQSISKCDYTQHFNKEVKKKIKVIEGDQQKGSQTIKDYQDDIHKTAKIIKDIQTNLKNLSIDQQQIQKEIVELKQKLSEQPFSIEEIDRLFKQRSTLESQLKSIESEIEDVQEYISQKRSEISQLQDEFKQELATYTSLIAQGNLSQEFHQFTQRFNSLLNGSSTQDLDNNQKIEFYKEFKQKMQFKRDDLFKEVKQYETNISNIENQLLMKKKKLKQYIIKKESAQREIEAIEEKLNDNDKLSNQLKSAEDILRQYQEQKDNQAQQYEEQIDKLKREQREVHDNLEGKDRELGNLLNGGTQNIINETIQIIQQGAEAIQSLYQLRNDIANKIYSMQEGMYQEYKNEVQQKKEDIRGLQQQYSEMVAHSKDLSQFMNQVLEVDNF